MSGSYMSEKNFLLSRSDPIVKGKHPFKLLYITNEPFYLFSQTFYEIGSFSHA